MQYKILKYVVSIVYSVWIESAGVEVALGESVRVLSECEGLGCFCTLL